MMASSADVAEAAQRLGMSRDWLYRHASELPFAVRIGRRVVFDSLARPPLRLPADLPPRVQGKPGQPIRDFWDIWRNALQATGLPADRLFHDLRRSAVRTLIRAGVDETTR